MCLCRQKDSRGTTALEKHNMENPLHHPQFLETLSGFCNLQAEGVPTLHAEYAGRFLAPGLLTIVGSGYENTCVQCTSEKGFSLPGLRLITVMASHTWVSLWRAPDKTQQCQ